MSSFFIIILAQNILAEPVNQVCHAYHAHLLKKKIYNKTKKKQNWYGLGNINWFFICGKFALFQGWFSSTINHRISLRAKSIKNNVKEVIRLLMRRYWLPEHLCDRFLQDATQTRRQTFEHTYKHCQEFLDVYFFFHFSGFGQSSSLIRVSIALLCSLYIFFGNVAVYFFCTCQAKVCRRLFIINCEHKVTRAHWGIAIFSFYKITSIFLPIACHLTHTHTKYRTVRMYCVWQKLLRILVSVQIIQCRCIKDFL